MASTHRPLSLPRGWLNGDWIISFCEKEPVKEGGVCWSTDAIENPSLLRWIQDMHFPQLTHKQFRVALRDMCRDERPGYRESPLPDSLRQVLNKRMQELGKRRWGCQAMPTDNDGIKHAADAAATQQKIPTTDTIASGNTSVSSGGGNAALHSSAQSPGYSGHAGAPVDSTVEQPMQSTTGLPRSTQPPAAQLAASSHDGRAPSSTTTVETPFNTFVVPPPINMHISSTDNGANANLIQMGLETPIHTVGITSQHTLEPMLKRFAAERPVDIGQSVKQTVGQSFGQSTGKFAEVSMKEDFEFSPDLFENVKGDCDLDTTSDGLSDAPSGIVQSASGKSIACLDINHGDRNKTNVDKDCDEVDHIFPEGTKGALRSRFLQSVDELASAFNDCGLVSMSHFHSLETHFTSCFSDPSAVAFTVAYIDRYDTLKPNPYTNQKCVDFFGVDLTKVVHTLTPRETVDLVKEMAPKCIKEGKMVELCGVWMSGFDNFGNPTKLLCDMWTPSIIINGNEAILLCAPHSTVTLLRQPGPYESQ